MNRYVLIIAALLLCVGAASGFAKIRVVASTSDLASIADLIGGDKVKVDAIVNGKSDPHFVELLPSYMVKVARADIYLKVGADLDYWADQIIDGSGNGKIRIVDCSQRVEMQEVPTVRVNASMGDIHVQGNPHYWLDPNNGLLVAQTITDALVQADAKNAAAYEAGLAAFSEKMEAKKVEWSRRAASLQGAEIVTYHNSWPYFCQAFGVQVVGFVEPKPGIEPTPAHTASLIDLVKERKIRVIGMEPYYSDRAPKTIARQTGATVVEMPTSVGGVDGASDYFSLFDTLIGVLEKAERSGDA